MATNPSRGGSEPVLHARDLQMVYGTGAAAGACSRRRQSGRDGRRDGRRNRPERVWEVDDVAPPEWLGAAFQRRGLAGRAAARPAA
jgi:hypothetical protein